MTKTERLVGLIGAVLGILGFIDTYVLRSKIASALSLPSEVPTGLLFAIALFFGVLLLFLSMRNSKLTSSAAALGSEVSKQRGDLYQIKLERQRLEGELRATQERSSELERQLQASTAARQHKAEYPQRLKKQIIALLTTQSRSESELQGLLGISVSDQNSRETLRETLGEMVVDKVVRRQPYGFNYELSRE